MENHLPPVSNGTLFDALVKEGKEARETDDQQNSFKKLWSALLKLDHWEFLTTAGDNFESASPFIGIVDNKPWVMAFTDPQKASEFAGKEPRFRNSNGELQFITVPRQQAIDWLFKVNQQGVFGVRINEGPYGWFSPIANIPSIINFLRHRPNP